MRHFARLFIRRTLALMILLAGNVASAQPAGPMDRPVRR